MLVNPADRQRELQPPMQPPCSRVAVSVAARQSHNPEPREGKRNELRCSRL